MKAAQGQAFASSVLKTMNLSRISMNATMKDVDPAQFMKRNDLFNNNHSRQTSSIPYLQAKEGTTFTELETNLSVSNKETATSKTQSVYHLKRNGYKRFTAPVSAMGKNDHQSDQAFPDENNEEEREVKR